ncbi:histidine phosphatase family protein [Corynebacterium sp. HMSC28B08]|uniref:histidine phosphatase family protein n=1 Tax=Corynebacterium sp. HMSC28B08 TaxID=1581066 RepID=UPI0008B90D88|nr:histidine phosphatase family protein [Corynebacterium sp. HMSC28B08]OFT91445.1 hypothetical protein HMPREF3098_00910 [Corynebacterium sp. HMSC28B08]
MTSSVPNDAPHTATDFADVVANATPQAEAVGVRRLFLVRHGQTTSNAIHALDTALPGADLTELGRMQATEAGTTLAERTQRARILSSQAARAQQTAVNVAHAFAAAGGHVSGVGRDGSEALPSALLLDDATAQHMIKSPHATAAAAGEVRALPGVAEIAAGDYEMRNDEDAHEHYHRILGEWLYGQRTTRVPGGETGEEVLLRYLKPLLVALAEHAERGEEDLALVSHGAVIRLAAGLLGNVPGEWAFGHYLPNAHMVELEIPEKLPGIVEGHPDELEALTGTFRLRAWGLHGTPE